MKTVIKTLSYLGALLLFSLILKGDSLTEISFSGFSEIVKLYNAIDEGLLRIIPDEIEGFVSALNKRLA